MSAPEPTPAVLPVTDAAELVAEDLIEEVSIDGMCGVY
jgi:mycofactocin precursor